MRETFTHRIESLEQLETELRPIAGYPGKLADSKMKDRLDEHAIGWIAKSPFVMMATSDDQGRCDVSPRGDAPGFVHVVDERHLFLPERPGNRRWDSIRNLLTNPGIGLIFLIPGVEETFRVNGRGVVTRDPALLEATAVQGKLPLMGIGVEIDECYLHCAKAFKRSGLWRPDTWLEAGDRPSVSELLVAHCRTAMPEVTLGEVEASLQESYTKRLY
ncbi:pyridoxamine 5'-phosphate oxidase family protein [Paenibacillus koleovorans]|uniref:pyridoxamine 5'-phosphate oxidase family protein n=1 Tax=Paenibacillus koleovorans TaxID=121608 RepID=UPI000FD8AD78|nr:pyridoxamine 5'-phosphate oxidase family protein [Paenibacillus koleovorans]